MNRQDIERMARIAERGQKVLTDAGVTVKRLEVMMDLEFCDEDVALDFEKLLAFGDGDFGHDITGIYTNFNRETKRLENCFVPRCAKREGGTS